MTAHAAEIEHEAVDREKSLRVRRRFEPAHLSLALPRRLVRHFGPSAPQILLPALDRLCALVVNLTVPTGVRSGLDLVLLVGTHWTKVQYPEIPLWGSLNWFAAGIVMGTTSLDSDALTHPSFSRGVS